MVLFGFRQIHDVGALDSLQLGLFGLQLLLRIAQLALQEFCCPRELLRAGLQVIFDEHRGELIGHQRGFLRALAVESEPEGAESLSSRIHYFDADLFLPRRSGYRFNLSYRRLSREGDITCWRRVESRSMMLELTVEVT